MGEIGNIEEGSAIRGHAIADRRRPQRMIDRKRLKLHPANAERLPGFHRMAIFERIMINKRPGLCCGIDRTQRTTSQPEGVIVMAMGENDSCRREPW